MNRKEAIEHLASIVTLEREYMTFPGWRIRTLGCIETAPYCQIFEGCYSTASMLEPIMHQHVDSMELFYQVKGECVFSDGQVLHVGEAKIIPPGVPHSSKLSKDGLCLIVVQPPEPIYKRLGAIEND